MNRCPTCGTRFEPKAKNHIYCTVRCSPRYNRIHKDAAASYKPQVGARKHTSLAKMAHNTRWRKANPEKNKAHNTVRRALLRGMLIRSEFCELCLASNRIEAHHPDYAEQLTVVWLCNWCHRAIEGRPIKYGA